MSSVIGYCRVSSREQSDNSSALDQQIARVKDAGAEEILVDVESGRSSREDDRTEFQRLMKSSPTAAIIITFMPSRKTTLRGSS
jgi:DNA invertase Pin-like site-specific DNA recombinase